MTLPQQALFRYDAFRWGRSEGLKPELASRDDVEQALLVYTRLWMSGGVERRVRGFPVDLVQYDTATIWDLEMSKWSDGNRIYKSVIEYLKACCPGFRCCARAIGSTGGMDSENIS